MAEKRPITIEDLYKITDIEDPRVSPDGRYIAYVQVTLSESENTYKRNIWLASAEGEHRTQITRSGKDFSPRFSPDGRQLAFVSARNEKPQIFLLPLTEPGGEPRPLTSMKNGAVAPEWSPDGSQIAFLSRLTADERLHEGEDIEKPADELAGKHVKEREEHEEKMRFDPRRVWRIPYRQGTSFLDERYAQVYVINTAVDDKEGKPIRLTDDDVDHDDIQWAADGKSLYVIRTTDPRADEPWVLSTVYRVSLEDKTSTCLIDDAFSYDSLAISGDGRWLAARRGLKQHATRHISRLCLIDTVTFTVIDLTVEMDREAGSLDWSPDGWLLFTSEDWGSAELYRVDPEAKVIEKVVEGIIEIQGFSTGPNGIAYTATTPVHPTELFWLGKNDDTSVRKTTANDAFLEEIIVQETHELRWEAPDGRIIQGWYLYPVGYEEGKRYPLAFNIHGGPHVMWSPASRTMWHEWQTHAASGYAVFYTNPRGAAGYGQVHHDGIAAKWGEADLPDLMSGIDALLELGFVDKDRMAVTGGSYGGFMTGWVVTHTDRFKAAVSQRGVYNLSSFYGTSDVPLLISSEFGVEPWEDQSLLWQYSPLAHAQNVTTPLLLIHSENDFRVPIEQAEQFFAFIHRSTDTPVELIRFPRDGHELSRSGEPRHRVARLTRMVEWFDRYCKA